LTLAREADAVAGAQRGPGVRRRSAGAALVVAVFVLTAIAEVKADPAGDPQTRVAGPETNIPTWIQAFTQFLTPTGRVTTLTSHDYGAQLRQGSSF
jgi:hypothetical protein